MAGQRQRSGVRAGTPGSAADRCGIPELDPLAGRCDLDDAHIFRATDRPVLLDVFCMAGTDVYGAILEDVSEVHRRIPCDSYEQYLVGYEPGLALSPSPRLPTTINAILTPRGIVLGNIPAVAAAAPDTEIANLRIVAANRRGVTWMDIVKKDPFSPGPGSTLIWLGRGLLLDMARSRTSKTSLPNVSEMTGSSIVSMELSST